MVLKNIKKAQVGAFLDSSINRYNAAPLAGMLCVWAMLRVNTLPVATERFYAGAVPAAGGMYSHLLLPCFIHAKNLHIRG